MGQEIVERLITKLQFTTHKEIREMVDEDLMSSQSLTNALSKLCKHNEVVTFKLSRRTIYLNPEFYEQIGIIQ